MALGYVPFLSHSRSVSGAQLYECVTIFDLSHIPRLMSRGLCSAAHVFPLPWRNSSGRHLINCWNVNTHLCIYIPCYLQHGIGVCTQFSPRFSYIYIWYIIVFLIGVNTDIAKWSSPQRLLKIPYNKGMRHSLPFIDIMQRAEWAIYVVCTTLCTQLLTSLLENGLCTRKAEKLLLTWRKLVFVYVFAYRFCAMYTHLIWLSSFWQCHRTSYE